MCVSIHSSVGPVGTDAALLGLLLPLPLKNLWALTLKPKKKEEEEKTGVPSNSAFHTFCSLKRLYQNSIYDP